MESTGLFKTLRKTPRLFIAPHVSITKNVSFLSMRDTYAFVALNDMTLRNSVAIVEIILLVSILKVRLHSAVSCVAMQFLGTAGRVILTAEPSNRLSG